MDEKNLLKEIAYYSRIINKYETSITSNNKVMPQAVNAAGMVINNGQEKNRFIYIKKPQPYQPPPTKVLINPNFKQSVHINPHFRKPTNMVHVNPKLITPSSINNDLNAKASTSVDTKPTVPLPASTSTTIITTPTKIVKCHEQTEMKPSTICSKYKINRKLVTSTERSKKLSTTYKLDRRNAATITPRRKRLFSSSFRSKFVFIKNPSTSLVKINGKVFKKIDTLVKKKSSKVWLCNSNKSNTKKKLVSIEGKLYQMNTNRKTLKIIRKSTGTSSSSSNNKQVCIKQNSAKMDKHRKRLFALTVRQKSIGTLVNKMQKNNIPCLLYRKFGRCKGLEKRTCKKVHNPDQIALCPKFLQGACQKENCLLSHRISAEKMPTCKFYLEGMCVRENCPYIHVKINKNAEICKDFLEGFCRSADKCPKRHQYLCPDFEKSGKCPKPKCRYPHNNKTTSSGKKPPTKTVEKIAPISSNNTVTVAQNPDDNQQRYYANEDARDMVSIAPDNSNVVVSSRPKLGLLPSFIPFSSS